MRVALRPVTLPLLFTALFPTIEPVMGQERVLSADEAYAEAVTHGLVRDAAVTTPFDLSRLPGAVKGEPGVRAHFLFERVAFDAGIKASAGLIQPHVRFEECQLRWVDSESVIWQGRLLVHGGVIEGRANFQHNHFSDRVAFHNVRIRDEAWFTQSVFEDRAEFIGVHWEELARFTGVRFFGPVVFNGSQVKDRIVFLATTFGGDASFIGFEAIGPEAGSSAAVFLNAVFKGDAEFRYCRFKDVRFSNRKRMTVFHRLADFRGCRFDRAEFDFADFRGMTSFVKASFGEGGASFKDVVFNGPLSNFDTVQAAGPLNFSNAYMPTLQFRWVDVGPALLQSQPTSQTLKELWTRLDALGRTQEALRLEYEMKDRHRQEVLGDSHTPIEENVRVILEWVFWGWPTGYGTKIGRIVVIAVICWFTFAVPLVGKRGLLIRVPSTRTTRFEQEKDGAARSSGWRPLLWSELPEGASCPISLKDRFTLSLGYIFSLLFKLGGSRVRYVERSPAAGDHGFERYFQVVAYVGTGLILLLALTVSHAIPAFQQIVSHVVF